jgi:predicted PurR-regulated permease PerM
VDSFWDFFWFILSFFLLMAYLVVLFQILTDLFRDRGLSGWLKAVWVLFLLFFPIITALVYLIVRGQGMTERGVASMRAAQADTDAYIRSVASNGTSPTDEIARAKDLLDAGAISQAEFEQLKAKALA